MRAVRFPGVVLAVLVAVALLGTMSGGMMGPWMMRGYGAPESMPLAGGWAWGLGMGLGWLAMLAFWGALLLAIALLVRWVVAQASVGSRPDDAQQPLVILRRRYAAGEIDRATYQQMKQELET